MIIQYMPMDRKGLFKSVLSIHNASYENTGNLSCSNGQYQHNISLFVKDPLHLLIYPNCTDLVVKAGDNVDYLCRPTDPSLDVVLKLRDYNSLGDIELKPGTQFKQMTALFSVYRGYTLINMIDNYYIQLDCYVNNSVHGTYTIQIHRPDLANDPEVVISPYTRVVGDTIVLNCIQQSYTTPMASWILPNHTSNKSDSFVENPYFYSKPGGLKYCKTTLTITKARKEFSGNYTCKGYYTSACSVWKHYKTQTVVLDIIDQYVLNLSIITKLTNKDKDSPTIEVKPGEPQTKLSVKIYSNPHSYKASWYYNDQAIYSKYVDGSAYHTTSVDGSLATLTIKNPKPKHSGMYTLEVNNSKFNKRIRIYVKVKDLVGVECPKLVVESDDVKLVCGVLRVKSKGVLQWCWTPTDAGEIKENCSVISQQNTTSRTYKVTLDISKVTKSKSGIYTCKDNGTVIDECRIDVTEHKKPVISKPDKTTITVLAWYPITLNCNATGIPSPTITWIRNNEILSQKNETLHIPKGVDQETEFKCIAKNHFGEDDLTYVVRLEDNYSNIITLSLITLLIISLSMASLLYYKRIYKFKKEIQELREFIDGGNINDLDPELNIGDQTDLLPYNKNYEFPRDKLTLGKVIGSGAFGLVRKGEAQGLNKDERVTTVAVKMAKRNSDIATVKALASELKILIHIGKHINVVNVLGACTGHLNKKELLVLVEYCQFGNLHNYLLKYRESFTDQLKSKTSSIDSAFEEPSYPDSMSSVFSDESGSCGINSEVRRRETVLSSTATDTPLLHTDKYDSSTSGASFSVGSTGYIESNSSLMKQSQECKTKNQRNNEDDKKSLSTQDLISWSFQIARGMAHLAGKKVLHGDLAARNVLLADNNIVKICDFGLSKNMYKENCYEKKGDDPLPVKWMALESIQYGIFSSKSDVWAYGVTLWELFSLGHTPYPDIVNNYKELIKELELGYRMPQPKYASMDIYMIMKNCWCHDASDRPSFSDLVERLSEILNSVTKKQYLELKNTFVEKSGQDYLHMNQPPSYTNVLSPPHRDPAELQDTTPMLSYSKDNGAIVFVSNPTYNKWQHQNSYLEMRSPTTKGEFILA